MSHEIETTNGQHNIAFLGDRNDIWHRLGQAKKPGATIESWAADAGLNWEALKVPAIASLEGAAFDHIPAERRFAPVPNCKFVVRSDNGHALGRVSDKYQVVQPREVLDWFERYISVDDRFQLDVAGALRQGEVIWATATFRDPLNVAGDKHKARLLMTTTFDGSGSTINQGSMTRAVCANTIAIATADKRAVIRTTHSTKFDAAKVGKELAAIAQGFAQYKAVGDALAQNEMTKTEVALFFKECLDIPFEAKPEDISSRKMNQFKAVSDAYVVTRKEGANGAWAALNAITRYVDHDRTSEATAGGVERVFDTTQFGSGAQLKSRAMGLLMPRVADKVLIAA